MAIVMSTAGACLSCLPAGLHSDAVPARRAHGTGQIGLVCWVRASGLFVSSCQATSCSTRRSIFRSVGRKRVDWRVDCPRPKRWRRARRKGEAKRRESRKHVDTATTSKRHSRDHDVRGARRQGWRSSLDKKGSRPLDRLGAPGLFSISLGVFGSGQVTSEMCQNRLWKEDRIHSAVRGRSES